MINKPRLDVVPARDLQRVFETAVDEIERAEGIEQPPTHRTPIFRRVPVPTQSAKRAVSDAACALAQLWKISPHPAR